MNMYIYIHIHVHTQGWAGVVKDTKDIVAVVSETGLTIYPRRASNFHCGPG